MAATQIPALILAGGKGMRMRDYSDTIPKALVPIGPYPVIVHVMKIYSFYGFNKFVIAIGHKGNLIREYFGKKPEGTEGFDITFSETGEDTNTGGRVKRSEKYLGESFFATYCDGLADVNLRKLLAYHKAHGKAGTLTAVHTMSPFGMVEISKEGAVTAFKEKPFLPGYINGGFFAFNKDVFDYLDDNCVLEEEPLRKMTADNELAAYRHDGFWTAMDTAKDVDRLNALWRTGVMPHTDFRGKPPWTHLEE
ncbi:MAG: sugar phosphate nucleotidyltransferase [Candidatus Micrarchaeia archaeon]|jgi:glucose-1-phosphate cytidylyltransferase